MTGRRIWNGRLAIALAFFAAAITNSLRAETELKTSASTSFGASSAQSAVDGDRFGLGASSSWRVDDKAGGAWWQVEFSERRSVGAILQVVGDHEFVFRNAPKTYHWEASDDGKNWTMLEGASVQEESRIYRIIRLAKAVEARFLRLRIDAIEGEYATLREVEFFDRPDAPIAFPDWIVAVNVTHDARLPGEGKQFVPLAKESSKESKVEAQQVWLTRFDPAFLAIEPQPLCAFLSGSFRDWCEVDRMHWRGIESVLKERSLPIWASCGGAQGLGLLAEYGTRQAWDCPHCRDPKAPKTPLYEHARCAGVGLACGKYEKCEFERGRYDVKKLADDPALAGLEEIFPVMESHCGQLSRPPKGWILLVTSGPKGLTAMQCMKLEGAPIYAAQFHIEMEGTPESSQAICANFLRVAREFRAAVNRELKKDPSP